MEFALTEEQQELASLVRSLLAKRGDPRAERYDAALWETLVDQIGATALAIPESLGGAGFTLFESLLVLEELGRALVPSPLLSSLVTAEALLAGADTEAQQRLLPRLAAGEPAAFVDATATPAGALEVDDVLDGDLAALVVVATSDGLVDAPVQALERRWTPSMDQTLRLASVAVTDRAAAIAIGRTGPAVRRARLVGAVGCAVLAAGGAARALEMTVTYAGQRVQFGRPIGSFQALKHRMADMLVQVEMARSAAWAAAYAVSVDAPDADRLTRVAKSWCCEAFCAVAGEAVQLHGGIAITWEHDAQLLLKRAHALTHLFGTPRQHRAGLELGRV